MGDRPKGASGPLLGHIDDPGLSILLQASVAQFGSDAGLLVAPEGNVGLQVEMPVDPDRARIDLRGHREGPIGILRPDAAAEPELHIVRARDGVFDLGVAEGSPVASVAARGIFRIPNRGAARRKMASAPFGIYAAIWSGREIRLVGDCQDLYPTAQTAHSTRKCPL
jgi:hypothetical protein